MGEIQKEQMLLQQLTSAENRNNLPPYLAAVREEAANRLNELTLPTTRHEEWKYTSLKPLLQHSYSAVKDLKDAADPGDISGHILPEASQSCLVFINGVYRQDLSDTSALPGVVQAGNLANLAEDQKSRITGHLGKHAQFDDDPFTPFNTANLRDGAFIFVPADTKVDRPLQLLFLSTDADEAFFTTPRCLILGEHHSEFTVIEDHKGLSGNVYLNSPVTEIVLDEGAQLTHVKLQRESQNAFHISRIAASIKKHSEYHSYAVHLGARLSRNDVRAVQLDEYTHCTLDGLVLVRDEQLSDTHSVMDHTMPNCTSHQLHKCIVEGKGESVFNGKIFVRQDAQKTNAFQENRNLLLSKEGTVNTKPQLEIWADDVKCSHGATIGQLDSEQVFYLKSRGLTEQKTREILSYGFALDVIESIPVKSIQESLSIEVERFARTGAEIDFAQ